MVNAERRTEDWQADRDQIRDWLIAGTQDQRFIDNIFVEFCERLNDAGVPVGRSSLFFNTLHPQWQGARILWKRGMDEAEIRTIDFGIRETPQFVMSPIFDIYQGAPEVRQRLEGSHEGWPDYPLYGELVGEGYTDYVAWPITHTLGKIHSITFSCDCPGGFLEEEVFLLRALIPAFSLVSEIRIKNVLARTLLETYVGPHASEEILAGASRRGTGVTVSAAVLICDLRDFTAISDLWPRDDVIDLLNGYFDAMAGPIEQHGGEILKFMGDGLLAIFPLSDPDASANLLKAIIAGQSELLTLNAGNATRGRPMLGYGIGVHVGDVMYGNIGSRSRLDFTAIGPAVNVASRLESLSKQVHRKVLLSRAFVELAGCQSRVDALGSFTLRGLSEAVEVFALHEV